MYLPKRISDFLTNAEIKPEAEGMSSADVYRCRTVSGEKEEYYYLKTEPSGGISSEREGAHPPIPYYAGV